MTIKKYSDLNTFEKEGVDSYLLKNNFTRGYASSATKKTRRIVCFGKISFDIDSMRIEVD